MSRLTETLCDANLAHLTRFDGVDSALEQADAAIQRVFEYKRILREHRNSLIPAAQLPQEVLSCIFMEHVSGLSWVRYCGVNLAFSQVCRRWRVVALEDPRLWTTPTSSCLDLGKAMLARSKGLPLSIHLQCHLRPSMAFIWAETVLAHHAQIRRLSLSASGYLAERLAERLSGAMPVLEELDLASSTICQFRSPALEDFVSPHLRTVCLAQCILPVRAKCFRNLTTLHISFMYPNTPTSFASIPEIVKLIKHNINIERLTLKNTSNVELPQAHFGPIPSAEKAVLKSLKFLKLEERAATTCAVLSSFAAPSLKQFHVLSPVIEADLVSFTRVVEEMWEWLQGPTSLGAMESVFFEIDEWCSLKFSTHRDTMAHPDYHPSALINVELMLSQGILPAVIDTFVRVFPSDPVRLANFQLNLPAVEVTIPLLNMLATLPSLHSIELEVDAYMAFVACAEQMPLTSENPFFPALENIILREPIFDVSSYGSVRTLLRRFAGAVKRLMEGGRRISVTMIQPDCPTHPSQVLEEMGLDVDVQDYHGRSPSPIIDEPVCWPTQ